MDWRTDWRGKTNLSLLQLCESASKICDDTQTRTFLITNTANLTSWSRRSVGCNGQNREVRNRENFSVGFSAIIWMYGVTAWSFCFVKKSLFSQSLKRIWEDLIVHSPCYESQYAYEHYTVWRLCCYIMENRIWKIISLKSIMTAVNETIRAVNEQTTATARCELVTSWLLILHFNP